MISEFSSNLLQSNALWRAYAPDTPRDYITRRQLMHVSIISCFSFVGLPWLFPFFVCPLLPLLSMHGVLHCGFGMIAGEDVHSCTLKVVICVKEGKPPMCTGMDDQYGRVCWFINIAEKLFPPPHFFFLGYDQISE